MLKDTPHDAAACEETPASASRDGAQQSGTAGKNSEVMEDIEQREKLKRINFSLTPSVRRKFERVAKEQGMSLTEYLRRAAFAAIIDPAILNKSAVIKAEQEYKSNLGPSRWTQEHKPHTPT